MRYRMTCDVEGKQREYVTADYFSTEDHWLSFFNIIEGGERDGEYALVALYNRDKVFKVEEVPPGEAMT